MTDEIEPRPPGSIADLPGGLPDLAFKATNLNGGYHFVLNGVVLMGFAGASAAAGAPAKPDKEKSVTSLAGQYIDWARRSGNAPALDVLAAEMLYAALARSLDMGEALRLDLVIVGQGSSNNKVVYDLFSKGVGLNVGGDFTSRDYSGTLTRETMLERGQGAVGRITYAVSVHHSKNGPEWTAHELEYGPGAARAVGLWKK